MKAKTNRDVEGWLRRCTLIQPVCYVWNIQAKHLIVNNFLTINLVGFSCNFTVEEVINSALNLIQTFLVAFFADLT